jgi:hypothetical protein
VIFRRSSLLAVPQELNWSWLENVFVPEKLMVRESTPRVPGNCVTRPKQRAWHLLLAWFSGTLPPPGFGTSGRSGSRSRNELY